MLPGGVYEEELKDMWGPDYQKHIDKLLNLSLTSRKDQHNDRPKLILPPFMVSYAEAKIDPEDLEEFHLYICEFYSNICEEIYKMNGKSYKSKKTEDVRESELSH